MPASGRRKARVFCDEHVPAEQAVRAAQDSGPRVYAASGGRPECFSGPAFALGLIIPGVGAIYNGQYAKGLVHAIIFGLLVSILSSGSAHGMEPLFGILIAAWVFYMAMEAYHTAQQAARGEAVDEFSSLINMHTRGSRFPAGAVVLIGLGVLLLLNTTDIIPLERVLRYWPVLLILLGVYMLYVRLTGLSEPSGGTVPGNVSKEVQHDQR